MSGFIYLIEAMMPCIWTRFPGPLAKIRPTALKIQQSISFSTWGTFLLAWYHTHFTESLASLHWQALTSL